MATIITPLIVLVVGGAAYGFGSNGKLSELGRIAFFVGLFWLVYLFAHATVRF